MIRLDEWFAVAEATVEGRLAGDKRTAVEWLEAFNRLNDCADAGDIAASIEAALVVGYLGARMVEQPNAEAVEQRGQAKAMIALGVDAVRGRTVREGARAGGKSQKKRPSDDVLSAAVAELRKRHPHMKRGRVCQKVGDQLGLSRRTVESHTPKWK